MIGRSLAGVPASPALTAPVPAAAALPPPSEGLKPGSSVFTSFLLQETAATNRQSTNAAFSGDVTRPKKPWTKRIISRTPFLLEEKKFADCTTRSEAKTLIQLTY